MLILALESSAGPASAAVYEHDGEGGNGRLLGQYYQSNGFSHSRTLLVMAGSLLGSLGLKPADIGLAAVAHGPGSFTGVRIGVSAAKGFAAGLGIPVCGVSALEAMAFQASAAGVVICPVMDARRGRVYNALFKWDGGTPARLREDRAVSIDDLAADLKSFGIPYMPVGDGAGLVLSRLAGTDGLRACLPCPAAGFQTAHGVALAAVHAVPLPAAQLEPVYLRPSQAERVRSAAGGG